MSASNTPEENFPIVKPIDQSFLRDVYIRKFTGEEESIEPSSQSCMDLEVSKSDYS